jgi:ABC-type Fe3+-hydroxamate transport system substrate-binding protein
MRVVSLVPSLTATLFDLGLDSSEVVGRTPWCIYPKDGVKDVMVVGGTKTPNLGKIRGLNPDLILMDKEENPLEVYNTLAQEGFKIFVSEVESPSDVPSMLRELGNAIGKPNEGEKLAIACEKSLTETARVKTGLKTIPLIWYKPLMAVSPNKYAGSILTHVGFEVVDTEPDGNGYPEVTIDDFLSFEIQLILLTSEPHEFTKKEGESIALMIESAGGKRPMMELIDGEDLTWFGSRTTDALTRFANLHNKLVTKKK